MWGLGVSTLLLYHIIKPAIKIKSRRFVSINIVIIMAGMGVGALNEIVEFIISILIKENGVGGYENTALDLIANLIGACVAAFLINKDLKKKIKQKKQAALKEVLKKEAGF
ncbi:MAG: hypothetical protein GF335_01075 [Candidatus Moranbacteria bacterium]|nr:hypothetical protein [Candidatus Moranbacteria bacterium]